VTRRLLILALALSAPAQGAQRAREPFDSFQAIDKALSLLDKQLAQADSLLQKAASGSIATSHGKRGRPPWNALGQQIFINVRSVNARTSRLQRRYEAKRVAQRLFTALMESEKQLMASAKAFQGSQTTAQAKTALQRVQQSRVDFVLAFHALSSDYGALRCQRKSWACCEIVSQDGSAACRWRCVNVPRQCTQGLLGPQSTAASAVVIRH
jgi:hypothetical protein